MRAYTLSLLSKLNEDGTPIVESEIIAWANNKVDLILYWMITLAGLQITGAGKTNTIKHFQDKANKSALPIIDLIDAIKTGAIDYSFVKTGSKLTGEVGRGAGEYKSRKAGESFPIFISKKSHFFPQLFFTRQVITMGRERSFSCSGKEDQE